MKLWIMLLFTTIMTSCSPAYADMLLDKPVEDQVIVAMGGWSNHFLWSENITNETHNIFGVEYSGWSAGYFKNSYGRDTIFIAKTWRKEYWEDIELSASLGISRGYYECFGPGDSTKNICPHGWVGVSFVKYKVVPAIRLLPGVILFSPEIRF